MEAAKNSKLIHIAQFHPQGGSTHYLLLREITPKQFTWFERPGLHSNIETETPVTAQTIEEAIRLAKKHWKPDAFRTLICGMRYTLPERDEHGINAFFYQMVASYNSPNGVYFDEELGHNCLVNFASLEARSLWQQLKQEGKL